MMWICIRLALLRAWRRRADLFCRVAALLAITLPLLIILGLKNGIVTTMKEQLLNNPASFALRMSDARIITPEKVEELRKLPGVAFVVPCVSGLYTQAEVLSGDKSVLGEVSVVPTAPGDPLLRLSSTPEPRRNEAVLSQSAADQFHVKVGDELVLRLSRNGRQEIHDSRYKVVGILPVQHMQDTQVYVPLEHTVAMQEFVVQGKGEPVSDAAVIGRSVYHGIVLSKTVEEAELNTLRSRATGWLLQETTAESHPGVPANTRMLCCNEPLLGKSATAVEQLQYLTRGALLPWSLPLEAQLQVGGRTQTVRVVSADAFDGQMNLCVAPPVLLLPPGGAAGSEEGEICLESPQGQSRVLCKLRESADVPVGDVWVTPQLAAVMHRASQQLLLWNFHEGGLRHPVVEFYSLRMYADTLENVPELLDAVQKAGVPCRAQLALVEQTLSLERSLNILFVIIASGAGAGAVISFGMSLFNAAELSRKDLALFQLLGAGKAALPLVPVTEAMVSASLALICSFFLFFATQHVISIVFAGAAGGGETSLCFLSWGHVVACVCTAVVTALAASLAASVKVLRISPSEILRES